MADSIEELNELLEAWDDAEDACRIGKRTNSVGADWVLRRQSESARSRSVAGGT